MVTSPSAASSLKASLIGVRLMPSLLQRFLSTSGASFGISFSIIMFFIFSYAVCFLLFDAAYSFAIIISVPAFIDKTGIFRFLFLAYLISTSKTIGLT